MRFINFDDVVIPARQRKAINPGKLQELATSILKSGLLHPPVIRKVDGRAILVAGERRFKALQALYEIEEIARIDGGPIPRGTCPYVLIDELDDADAKEAELEENIRRVDLTWQDEAGAIAELANLRLAQDHTKGEIAEEIQKEGQTIGAARARLTQAVAVVERMDDPDIQRSESLQEAYKKTLRKNEQEFAGILANKQKARSEEEQGDGPPKLDLHHGDAFELLPKFQAGTYDCIISDPPYGIDATEFGEAADLAHQYQDSREYGEECMRLLASESYRLCKDQAHVFMFCDVSLFSYARQTFENEGFWTWPWPLVWYKGGAGHAPHPDHGPRRSYELIFYAIKGLKKINHAYIDTLRDLYPPKEKFHAAQKPWQLYSHLLATSCKPGDKVLDPFCGSGPVFLAADHLNLRATGIEADKKMIDLCHLQMMKGTKKLGEEEGLVNL